MTTGRRLAVGLLLASVLSGAGCDYVVVPPEESAGPAAVESKGWGAIATGVGPGIEGGTRIDLTIRNDTGAWSAMEALADRSAVLTTGDGTTVDCATVLVGSGGHRLAPGFQMRGFIAGPKAEQTVETIRVECDEAEVTPGSRLAIDYSYVTGEYNYYEPDASRTEARLEVELDEVADTLDYPIAQPIEGLVQPPGTEIPAINDMVLTLDGVSRSGDTLTFDWRTSNPGEYPSSVHIGNPPVIGSDGVLYGFYQSPDLASVPITPPAGQAEWTTEVEVPADVTGLVIPLSVESRKQRTFINYAIGLEDD